MHVYPAIIERCLDTGYYVGYVPNFPGAHTQAETLDELYANLQEVIALLLEDGEPEDESDLLLTINQGLSPDVQQRFETLVAKRQVETLNQKEQQELIALTAKIEQPFSPVRQQLKQQDIS